MSCFCTSVFFSFISTLLLFHQTAPWPQSCSQTHLSKHILHTKVPFAFWTQCHLPPLNCHLGHVLSPLYGEKHHTSNKSLLSTQTNLLCSRKLSLQPAPAVISQILLYTKQVTETQICSQLTGKPQGVAPGPHEGAKVLGEQSPALLHVWVTRGRGRGRGWSLVETTLRSIGRGVGHTHGWLRVLGEAEEESKREGRGRRRELSPLPEP